MTQRTAIRILTAMDVDDALDMRSAIEIMRHAFAQLSEGRAAVPQRVVMPLRGHSADALAMPAFLPSPPRFAVKVVSVHDENPSRNLPLIHAVVILFEAETGSPLALMDGERLTAIRTGAASGLATDLLARPDASVVAIFGAGIQARAQLEAVCEVRSVERARVVDPDSERAKAFVEEMERRLEIPISTDGPGAALRDADVVCAATTAGEPLFSDSDVAPGTHVNAVGSYKPDRREIPGETMARARVVVDEREACLSEAGDLAIPIREGLMKEEDIHAEIGEVAAGHVGGRRSTSEITVFKSVGNAVQDVASAAAVYERAVEKDLGTVAPL